LHGGAKTREVASTRVIRKDFRDRVGWGKKSTPLLVVLPGKGGFLIKMCHVSRSERMFAPTAKVRQSRVDADARPPGGTQKNPLVEEQSSEFYLGSTKPLFRQDARPNKKNARKRSTVAQVKVDRGGLNPRAEKREAQGRSQPDKPTIEKEKGVHESGKCIVGAWGLSATSFPNHKPEGGKLLGTWLSIE